MKAMSLEDEFEYGQYAGKQLEDVIEDHPLYVEWLIENDIQDFDEEALELITKKGIA